MKKKAVLAFGLALALTLGPAADRLAVAAYDSGVDNAMEISGDAEAADEKKAGLGGESLSGMEENGGGDALGGTEIVGTPASEGAGSSGKPLSEGAGDIGETASEGAGSTGDVQAFGGTESAGAEEGEMFPEGTDAAKNIASESGEDNSGGMDTAESAESENGEGNSGNTDAAEGAGLEDGEGNSGGMDAAEDAGLESGEDSSDGMDAAEGAGLESGEGSSGGMDAAEDAGPESGESNPGDAAGGVNPEGEVAEGEDAPGTSDSAGDTEAVPDSTVDGSGAESSEGEEETRLPAPTGLKWDGTNAVWDLVPGAESYVLEVYKDEEKFFSTICGSHGSFPVLQTGEDGTYWFRVKAKVSSSFTESDDDSEWSDPSEEITLTPERIPLDRPTGAAWSGEGIVGTWDEVENAKAYQVEVYKDGQLDHTWDSIQNLSVFILYWGTAEEIGGTYRFRVKALVSTDPLTYSESEWSDFSEERTIERDSFLATPTGLRWDEQYAVWDPVPGAEYYQVQWYKDGESMWRSSSPTESRVKLPFLENGIYQFKVTAMSSKYYGSAYSDLSGELEVNRPPFEGGQLPTPTGLRWGTNWTAEWDAVPEAEGYYTIELYKDDEYYFGRSYIMDRNSADADAWLCAEISESGTYKWHVKANNRYDPEHYIDSEWSDFSEEKEYVRPETAMGTTVGHWSDTKIGYFILEEPGFYELNLYCDDYHIGGMRGQIGEYNRNEEGYYEDFSNQIDSHGKGRYRVRARVLSDNIDEIAHGEWGDFSDYLDTTKISQNISEAIDSLISGSEDAGSALEAIKDSINQEALRTAMQTDDTVRNQMKELEAAYAEEKGISVNETVVSEDANEYVKPEDITMVGAGLNAEAGQALWLEVSVPEKKEDIDSKLYANSVQLDIQLKRGEDSIHELEVPITITLPVPVGLDVKRLVIFHYRSDGSFETVNPKINGDETITFTVTRFSTFVFAEEKEEDPEESPEPSQTPAVSPEPSQTPAASPEPSQTPAASPEPSQAPAASAEPSQAPAASAEPSQAPAASAEPSQAPAASAEPSQAPAASPEPSQAPAASAEPSQAPAASAEPSQAPAASAEPSQAPAASAEPSQAPAASAEPSQAPAASAEPSQAPAASPEPSQAPAASAEPSQAPAASAEPSQAPAASAEPSQAPAASAQPSQEPDGNQNSGSDSDSDTGASGAQKDDVPKTGDTLPAAIPVSAVVFLAAIVAFGVAFVKRRKPDYTHER